MNGSNDPAPGSKGSRGGGSGKTTSWFDPSVILNAADRAIAKSQSKFGAFVRQRDRTSIRYRDKPSAAGQPPSAHRTMMRIKPAKKGSPPDAPPRRQMSSPLRDFLYFARDNEKKSVVIGPAKTNQIFFDHNREPVRGTIPSVIEEGGQITVFEVRKGGRWIRADTRSRRRFAGLQSRFRTVTIAAHPHTKPAFDAELPKFMSSLEGSVTPG